MWFISHHSAKCMVTGDSDSLYLHGEKKRNVRIQGDTAFKPYYNIRQQMISIMLFWEHMHGDFTRWPRFALLSPVLRVMQQCMHCSSGIVWPSRHTIMLHSFKCKVKSEVARHPGGCITVNNESKLLIKSCGGSRNGKKLKARNCGKDLKPLWYYLAAVC